MHQSWMFVHPVEIDLLVILRREADGLVAVGIRLDGGDGLFGHDAPPLLGCFLTAMNHCVERRGSTTVLQRSQWPTLLVWSLMPASSPCASRSATIFLRAT